MPRPLCPVCGKQIPKLTTTVWVEAHDRPEQYRQPATQWSRTIYPEVPPRSIADCRKLSNQQVASVTYHADHGSHAGTIWRFTEWDGETYWTASYPFCKPECATIFARAAYKAGYRLNRS